MLKNIQSVAAAAVLTIVLILVAFARSWSEGDIALAFFLRIAAAVLGSLGIINLLSGNHRPAAKLGGMAAVFLALVYIPKAFGPQLAWVRAQKNNADIATRHDIARRDQPQPISCEPPWQDAEGNPVKWVSFRHARPACYDRGGIEPDTKSWELEPVDPDIMRLILSQQQLLREQEARASAAAAEAERLRRTHPAEPVRTTAAPTATLPAKKAAQHWGPPQ